jgi:hypothetical protein
VQSPDSYRPANPDCSYVCSAVDSRRAMCAGLLRLDVTVLLSHTNDAHCDCNYKRIGVQMKETTEETERTSEEVFRDREYQVGLVTSTLRLSVRISNERYGSVVVVLCAARCAERLLMCGDGL